jgi:nitroimidazol reductase NimA-like FMN-containing flavoprotein (pyridoxamine 5'-phosphate oxidase superfamily)
MRRVERKITDKKTQQEILAKGLVCHLAMSENNRPYVLGMNYGWEWSGELPVLHFHCSDKGRKIDILKKNHDVAFFIESDLQLKEGPHACSWSMKFKSLAGEGKASFINESHEKERSLQLIMKQYSGRDDFDFQQKHLDSVTIFRVAVSQLSGKYK